MQKPQPFEYTQSQYVSRYIESWAKRRFWKLAAQLEEVQQLFSGTGEEKSGYRYAEGKWSLKELLGHMVDTERIMAYRALCIARGEKQPLPGFDENAYAQAAGYGHRPLADLRHEHRLVREGTSRGTKSTTWELSASGICPEPSAGPGLIRCIFLLYGVLSGLIA